MPPIETQDIQNGRRIYFNCFRSMNANTQHAVYISTSFESPSGGNFPYNRRSGVISTLVARELAGALIEAADLADSRERQRTRTADIESREETL